MAEVVGLIASSAAILEALITGYKKVRHGSEIVDKLNRVKEQFEILESAFGDDHNRARFSGDVLDVADSRLRAVKQILDSISSSLPAAIRPNSTRVSELRRGLALAWYGIRRGRYVNKNLDEVQIKLGTVFQEIMLLRQIIAIRYPPDFLLPDVNPISIGLDRAIGVLQFLSPLSPQSAGRSSGLYVVGIVGQGGLGKYTLLNHIMRELLHSVHAFDAVAYVELVGDEPDKKALREVQTSLLWQLGGPHKEFQSLEGGKSDLRARFEALQMAGKSMCIAIENVWRAQDLENILPHRFASSLPSLTSCILITSRVQSIAHVVGLHCGGNPNVLVYEPQLMSEEASRELLLAHANLGEPDHHVLEDEIRLVKEIFPLCGGLPLALRLVGCLFARQREAYYWEEWKSEMVPERAGIPLRHIDHILELSYKNLPPRSQEALLAIGACLCGWPWEDVQNIVGSLQMDYLKDFSLIDSVNVRGLWHNDVQVVRMHDLIRKLAATKLSNSDTIIWNPDSWSTSLLSNNRIYHVLKFLCLDVEKAEEARLLNGVTQLVLAENCLKHMQKLQVLALCGSFNCAEMRLPESLRFIRLERNGYVSNIKFPRHLQQLELKECSNLAELPSSLYECEDLRYLCIVSSPTLQGFNSCTKWKKLSRLWLEGCARITRVPEDLEELKWLSLINCERLQHLPFLYSKLESQNVHINACPCRWPPMPLQALPIAGQSIVVPPHDGSTSSIMLPQALPAHEIARVKLPSDGSASSKSKKLDVSGLLELQSLAVEELNTVDSLTIRECGENQELYWQALANMVSLKKLRLRDCEWLKLEELPDEMRNLTKLKLNYCKLLKVLPDSICNLNLLVRLSLRGCLQLQELPEEIGSLSALEVLDLTDCECLRRLPNSLCRMESLKELDMIRCSRVERLPQELGNLSSLRKLRISNCASLTMLPDSMCGLVSLKELDLTRCSKLEELPEMMGNLSSLRKLQIGFCSNLKRLPQSICNLAHLFSVLDLEECTQLNDVPEEILRLNCLRM